MIRKNFGILFFISLFVGLLNVHHVYAKDEKESQGIKIAIVNNQLLSQELEMSKDMHKKASAKEESINKLLVKKEEKISKDFQLLESKRSVLSGDELKNKARALEKDYQQLQMDKQIYVRVFEMTRMLLLQEISSNVSKATNKVANGVYDMVLPMDITMYIDQSKFKNITKEVISKTNDIAKTVNFDKIFKQAEEQVRQSIRNAGESKKK